jgi:hypothetical protein
MRVKTGHATAVVVAGLAASPKVIRRCSVELCDPAIPESKHPYHAELELPQAEGAKVVKRATDAVRAVAERALRDLVKEVRDGGCDLRGIALVIGSAADPWKLANPHIRAHALEGRLFWQVLDDAAKKLDVACSVVLEREVFAKGAAALGKRAEHLKTAVVELGRSIGKPWGGEEKTAAVAAWIMLAQRRS